MSNHRKRRHKANRQRDQVIAKALRNRDETRDKLLAQGRELARRRAENVERSRKRTDDTGNSAIASVHSTMPSMDSNGEAAARHSHSTVPAQPKGTTVPAAVRLYGLRLYDRIRSDVDERDGTAVTERESETPVTAFSPSDSVTANWGDR